MKISALLGAVAVLGLAGVGVAHGKGMAAATIEGPGLAEPIVVFGKDPVPEARWFVEDTGVYELIWPTEPTGRLATAPTADLGPRLTVRWLLMGPDGDIPIAQDVYPHADGGPVTHVAPGQPTFEGTATIGGWYRSPARLLDALDALGVPGRAALVRAAAGVGERGERRWEPIGASLLAMIVLGGALKVAGRRRGEVAPAAG